MPDDRRLGRNVHFYNALDPDHALDGLVLNPSVTEKVFLFMLEILILASAPYTVSFRETGAILSTSDERLNPGLYDIQSSSPIGTISITDEQWIRKARSSKWSARSEKFRNQVRERDRATCVITGMINVNAYRGSWTVFEVAHIFPLLLRATIRGVRPFSVYYK